MKNESNSIVIIGAGFAGLAAGIYAQMNGYNTRIFEMHNQPGGLCTAWQRKGYTIDGCIHWLVGSSPESGMHDLWEEVGIAQNREFINLDEYTRFEDDKGRSIVFYTDIDKLERALLACSPEDKKPIKDFIKGIRLCLFMDPPSSHEPFLKKLRKGLKTVSNFAIKWKRMKHWMKTPAIDFASRFKDPLLQKAFREMWIPEFSIFFMMYAFACLHNKNAGYPIGGSLPMSKAIAEKYISLGGTIHYNSRVEKILVSNDQAVGIRLADGTEHTAGRIISAADGYTTIFKMLRGKYGDFNTSEPYEKWPIFEPLIYIGMGINRSFEDVPKSVSGMMIGLKEPVEIAGVKRDYIFIHPYNHDPSLAPEGKTTLICMIPSSYEYWKTLADDQNVYKAHKEQIAQTVTKILDERFPGLASDIEMVDIATPLTFKRYTGNWKGSYEGWLITPKNAHVLMKRMKQTINGLDAFYMCGQWVEPGGGLPTSIMSGKRLIKKICKEDKKKFHILS